MIWEDPFDEIEKLHRRIHRLMRGMWRGVWEPISEEVIEPIRWRYFPVDISETEDEVIVRADLPGFERGEIKVNVTENSMEITAQKKEEKREKTETFFKAERRAGAMRRYFSLPTEVNPDTAKASYENGVLEIRAKKLKTSKKIKEIKVE
ncbi:MAG: Hsp20/alpha crystallin family protein [Candidatus Aenigmatarchaeota archaeon]